MAADDTKPGAVTVPDRPIVPRPPALMFGVPIADLTMAETLTTVAELVEEGRRFGRTHQVSTVNVDFLVNGLKDPEVRSILQRAALCLADGMPVVWAARRLGMPVRERVAGADLLPRLVEASASNGQHVHVYGSTPDVADAARRLLAERYPGAHFSIDPGVAIRDVREVSDDVLDPIRAVGADILCVALGNPKQERFIALHGDRLGIPVMIGVGGSLDMLVGEFRRAPTWMQGAGLEWAWRAGQEPRRLGYRYAHDARVFGPAIVEEMRRQRRRAHGSGVELALTDDAVNITVDGARPLGADDWATAASAIIDGLPLVLDGDADRAPSDAAAAQLVGLTALVRRRGGAPHWHDGGVATDWALQLGLTPELLGGPSG
jgi:N-acetylglucosaminyldiphosphoundecaprenol N-acetyl-beta-D-mannosaminyltransferase